MVQSKPRKKVCKIFISSSNLGMERHICYIKYAEAIGRRIVVGAHTLGKNMKA
jgi:hypothetical protein